MSIQEDMKRLVEEIAAGREVVSARDIMYIAENRASLSERFPEQWIAVQDKEVVAHENSLTDLLSHLEQHGIDSQQAAIMFLTRKNNALILTSG